MWWKISRFFQMFLETFGQNISKIFKNKHRISSHPRGWVWLMISRLHPYVIFFWVLNLTCKLSLSLLLHLVNCVFHFVIIFNCLLVFDAIIRFGLCFVCFFKFLSLLYFMHYCNVEMCSTMFIWTIVQFF
jgi:Na+/H+-dicarboxylate symporter